MIPHIGLAVTTFVVTNIDDLLILSIYFATPTFKTRNIVFGQYLGIVIIILLSLTGVIIDNFVSDRWISLLGILPIIVGVKELLSNEGDERENVPVQSSRLQFLNVAVITIANGGDNIGVYIPLFASLPDYAYVTLYVLAFLFLTGILCFVAHYLTNHPTIKQQAENWGHKILPYFLICLGLFIMKDFFVSFL